MCWLIRASSLPLCYLPVLLFGTADEQFFPPRSSPEKDKGVCEKLRCPISLSLFARTTVGSSLVVIFHLRLSRWVSLVNTVEDRWMRADGCMRAACRSSNQNFKRGAPHTQISFYGLFFFQKRFTPSDPSLKVLFVVHLSHGANEIECRFKGEGGEARPRWALLWGAAVGSCYWGSGIGSPPPTVSYRFLGPHNQITHPEIRTTVRLKPSAAPSLPASPFTLGVYVVRRGRSDPQPP